MCCNADILFCVIVLHWVTAKDKPSSYASTHASRANTVTGTHDLANGPRRSVMIVPEKRDSSLAKEEVVQFGAGADGEVALVWPYDSHHEPAGPEAARLPGSVTTEIHSAPQAARGKNRNGRVLHRTRNEDDEGDEVELRNIHVHREVCIDSGCSSEAERLGGQGTRRSVEDAWGVQRSVSAEKMV